MRRSAVAPAGAAGLLALLGLLWLAARAGWTDAADAALLMAIGRGNGRVWNGLTVLADTEVRFVVGGLVALLLFWWGRRRDALFLLVAIGLGAAFNEGLKGLAGRARPDLLPALDLAHGTSFPSGHSAGALVLGGALALVAPPNRRTLALAAALLYAVVIGWSRVALAVHWPSDVLAGWLAGAAWLILAAWVFADPSRRAAVAG